MPSRSHRDAHTRKRLVDYFPEERIVITSGLVLLAVALLSLSPIFTPQGLVYEAARVPVSPLAPNLTFLDAIFVGFLALAFVFVLVFAVQRWAKNI